MSITIIEIVDDLKVLRQTSEQRRNITERMHEMQQFSLGTEIVGWDDPRALIEALMADAPLLMTMTEEGLTIVATAPADA